MSTSNAAVESFAPSHAQLLCCILLVIVAWIVVWRMRHWYRSWALARRWSVARAAEAEAPARLLEMGYRVLDAQVAGNYSLVVDGEPHRVALRADYLVTRNGLLYVAEVKSGRKAPRLDSSATRRQLLEYSIAYAVDGVLLVDGMSGCIHRVEFPQRLRPAGAGRLQFFAMTLLLLLVAAAIGLSLFGL